MDRQPKVLVIGDAMMDYYYFGTTTRISPEAPIPVVKITEVKAFEGGAGNVVNNLQALGADVRLVSGGQNRNSIIPCPAKNRLMVGEIQLARWDENDSLPPINIEFLNEQTCRWTPDAIVVSDYGKGSVDRAVINWLEDKRHIPTFIDTKRNPDDFGYFEQTFFPNQVEYTQYKEEYTQRSNVIYKKGAQGVERLRFGKVIESFRAYAKQVVSVCGAGDSILASYVYYNCPPGHPDALFRASIAAAVVVEKPWTATASVAEIEERIKCLDTKKA
jgi:D-beta-D-heptose 7-phosphate kinase/D-beta-D-heptose 1-phosphate adenosyltransferase